MGNGVYKLSDYNVLFSTKNNDFLWNTLSNAAFQLDKLGKQYIESFSGFETESEYFKLLSENGCIVPINYDELGKILIDEKKALEDSKSPFLNFIISPGLGCNYRCVYCFEGNEHPNVVMDKETLTDVYTFISNKLQGNGVVRVCNIKWFGGEPLLYLDQIQNLSYKLIDLCEKLGIHYSAKMITNGRYLSKDKFEILKKCKIMQFQVSVDGMQELYCKNKKASCCDFYEVISNIKNASEYFKVVVRINVDSSELTEAKSLVDFLLNEQGLEGKIKLYFAFIKNYGLQLDEEVNRNKKYNYAKNTFDVWLENEHKLTNKGLIPLQRKITSCTQICKSSQCIGPRGEIYKCESNFGNHDEIIGSIYEESLYNSKLNNWYTLEHLPKCKECVMFPVCLGGCLNDRKNNRHAIDCESYIEMLIRRKACELQNIAHN